MFHNFILSSSDLTLHFRVIKIKEEAFAKQGKFAQETNWAVFFNIVGRAGLVKRRYDRVFPFRGPKFTVFILLKERETAGAKMVEDVLRKKKECCPDQ